MEYCGLGKCWPNFDYKRPCNGNKNNLTCTEDGYFCFNKNCKQIDCKALAKDTEEADAQYNSALQSYLQEVDELIGEDLAQLFGDNQL